MEINRISIIGIGLIGGSLAKAFRQRTGIRDITAVGRNQKILDRAVADGTITRGFTVLNEHVYNSDIIFICTPVRAAVNYLIELSGRVQPRCIVTDVASTKGEISAAASSLTDHLRFIGGHPMAGSEKAGYGSSYAHLFENAYYILTPGDNCEQSDLQTMKALIRAIGAIPVELGYREHDLITAIISHIPHIAAAALVNLAGKSESWEVMKMLAAGGFKDMTRIASSDPEMWESIIMSNREQVLSALSGYEDILSELRRAVDSGNTAQVVEFFRSAGKYRSDIRDGGKGLIEPIFELDVDIMDKPGAIGKVSTLLGNNLVNIKNMNVVNSRENFQGCLRISLSDSENLKKAFKLLKDSGYGVFSNSDSSINLK